MEAREEKRGTKKPACDLNALQSMGLYSYGEPSSINQH